MDFDFVTREKLKYPKWKGVITITQTSKEYPALVVLAPDGPQGSKLKIKVDSLQQEEDLFARLNNLPEENRGFSAISEVVREMELPRADT